MHACMVIMHAHPIAGMYFTIPTQPLITLQSVVYFISVLYLYQNPNNTKIGESPPYYVDIK